MHNSALRRPPLRSALFVGTLALGLTALSAGPALAASAPGSVTLTATPASVTVGDTVDLSVGLVGTTDVFTYTVTLDYDPAVFDYVDDSITGPAGGFDTVDENDGSLTIVHTRLGTSPTVSGDLTAGLEFATIGAGDTTIEVSSVTIVDSANTTATVADAAAADIVVEPVATPTPTASPEPSSSATAAPAPAASSTATPLPVADRPTSPLASTGVGFGVAGLAAAAVAAMGAGLVVARRRKAGTR